MICQDTKSSKTNSYRSNKDFPTFSTILKIEKSGGFPAYTRAKSKNVKKIKHEFWYEICSNTLSQV
jgi:hypothetical protein